MWRTIPCSCEQWCGEMPEEDDEPGVVCKGLRDKPQAPLVEIVLVHRDDSRYD